MTSWPRFTSGQTPSHALWAAIPPVTPTRIRAIRGDLPLVVVLDLALGDFLEGDRQVVLRARLDERRGKVLERPLTELVVVVVDLPGALRRDEHEAVAVGHVHEQLVDAWVNHPPNTSYASSGGAAPLPPVKSSSGG